MLTIFITMLFHSLVPYLILMNSGIEFDVTEVTFSQLIIIFRTNKKPKINTCKFFRKHSHWRETYDTFHF